jgi:hypothetical protein
MVGEVATLPAEFTQIGQVKSIETGEQKTENAATPDLTVDPKLKSLIPPLSASEYVALRDSISREGCRDPLTIWKNHQIILDGHNRYQICQELNASFKVVEIDLPDLTAAKIWMIKNQRGRRNLDESQRAMLAVKLEALYAEQAKERKGTRTDLGQKLDQSKAGRSAEKAAKDMGVSHQTVSFAKAVSKKGIPELAQLAESGKVAVSAAARVTALDPQIQAQIVDRVEIRIKEGRHPKIGTIIKEIVPKDAKNSVEENLGKVSKNLKTCLKLLDGIKTAPTHENLAEMQDAVEKIAAKLKEIETQSLDPSCQDVNHDSNGQYAEIVTDQPETEPVLPEEKAVTIVDEDCTEAPANDQLYSNEAVLPDDWAFYGEAIGCE